MYEVIFFKKFIAQPADKSGPIETSIYWGSEEECKKFVDIMNIKMSEVIQGMSPYVRYKLPE